jgi:hypothetical protein
MQEGNNDICEQATARSKNLLPMKQHSSQDGRCLDEQSHTSKMLMPMMKS